MITDRIRKIVADNADRTAVKVGAETISYAELWRRAEEVGDFLRRQGPPDEAGFMRKFETSHVGGAKS